ncbi:MULTISPECIES: ROK family transcriptional regulator [unclassified Streptomyces]|uniref:ROK family transcriptional regulator n=1 Tax=unclassified Streptomyces TaxID=2593676 RepID=UPI000F448E9B|nr:ROK family transcriptional regulator [Streptomyces sp. I6]RNL70043.1 ROK family transcriptional regulator [Streptomyces sp. I6]
MHRTHAVDPTGEDAAVPATAEQRSGLGGNLSLLRNHNASLVLDLLRTGGEAGISRPEIADYTGLTPQAVSKITARLREAGLLAEAGRHASTGGKPRTALRLEPSAAYAVGVQLDRDEMTAVLLDLSGARVATRAVTADLGAGPDVVTGQVAGQVRALVAQSLGGGDRGGAADASAGGFPEAGKRTAAAHRPEAHGGPQAPGGAGAAPVLGVGVAMPGPLDHRAGVPLRVTGYPEWDGYPLRDELANRLGLPVALDKDTNAAALGILLQGESGSLAYVHIGTGIGAGLVLEGAVYRGVRTGAGEFGHQVLQLDGPACACGKRGCLEALCLAAIARGDVADAARVLAVGVTNLAELLDIDQVLLGGRAVAAAETEFVRGVRAALRSRTRVMVAPAGGSAYRIAEGAAQLILAPVFGRGEARAGLYTR